MALPPFLARLIGDRSAVAPDLANAANLGSIGGRFPHGLTTNVVLRNPYRADVAPQDFPDVPIGWHPGIPPILHFGPSIPGKTNPPTEAPHPISLPNLPRIIPGGR